MVKKFKTIDPQLVFAEQTAGSAVVLTNEAKLSLYKKSQKSGYSTDILETVYYRGYKIWNESFGQTPEQFAFDRVNSFIAGGFAADLDDDLVEAYFSQTKPKQGFEYKGKVIGAISKMSDGYYVSRRRKEPDKKTSVHLMQKHKTREDAEKHLISKSGLDENIEEDAKGYKNPTGGLTQKGRDHYNRETGGHLQAPVTTPPSKLKHDSKAAGRRRSFCARMGGVEGPMKKPNGEPTRKALALRKWNCEETINEGIQTTSRKDLHGKDSKLHHKELKASGYVSKGNNANYKNPEGTEHSYYHPKSNTMHVFRAKGGIINHAYELTPNISYAKAHGADVHEDIIAEKRGLWDNIHAKQERIKHGSGEHMRKPGSEGAPTAAALKNSQNEEAIIEAGVGDVRKLSPGAAQEWREKHKLAFAKIKAAKLPPMSKDQLRQMAADAMKNTAKMQKEEKKIHTGKHFKNAETSEKQSHNPNDPDSRFDGTTSGKDVYTKATPGQVIKRVIKEIAIRNIKGEMINIKNQKFRGSDNKIHSAPPGKSSSSGGGGGSDES